ncbi:MAG: ribonuclease HII [Methanosarcinales archaeon]|nr:ribonuclease HII [Methanosarcinales archaeon]
MREIGIDEAGKGPVIGSMFVAGVLNFEGLEELGVKDSKRLSPAKREYLAERIEATTEVFLVEMTASEIDEGRKGHTMNEIMVERFSEVIKYFQPDRAIVDAADVKPERFAANLRANYEKEVDAEIKIISESKADDRYPLVSAASIVAKVHRDRSMRALAVKIGAEIGSGYPADPKTVKFLKELLKEKDLEDIPSYVRKSWKTVDLYITKGYK